MRAREDVIKEVLAKTYLFSNFSGSEISEVVAFVVNRTYQPGEVVFEQGSRASSLYIINFGSISIEVNDHESYESYPVMLGNGQVFGESHFHLSEDRVGAVKVRETSELYEIPYSQLENFFLARPELELKFLRSLSQHLGRYCHNLIEGMIGLKVRIHVNEGISSFV